MKIETLVLGPIKNNTYIVSNQGKCVLIDPSEGFLQIMQAMEPYSLEAILITHAHWDHVFSLNQIQAATHAKTYMHREEEPLLAHSMTRLNQPLPEIDVLLTGGESLELIGLPARALHTPGHAKGCVCYILGEVMFSGDTLFKNSIGRTDLETSDPKQMEQTLRMLAQTQEEYALYPGHGDSSTLAYERQHNPYLTAARQ